MTKRRCVVMAFLAMLAVAITLPILLAEIPRGPGPTKANFDKLEKGMTPAEVEAILGLEGKYEGGMVSGAAITWWRWTASDGSSASVTYIADSHSTAVYDMSWTPSNETTVEKLKRWLHLSA